MLYCSVVHYSEIVEAAVPDISTPHLKFLVKRFLTFSNINTPGHRLNAYNGKQISCQCYLIYYGKGLKGDSYYILN